MTPYHTADEVRRYDLMKLGVLALLLVLLLLVWVAMREDGPLGEAVEPVPTVVAGADSAPGEPEELPVPTLVAPSVSAPAESLTPGMVTLSGTAGPGARLVILADGQPVGTTSAGSDGAWSTDVVLPSGEFTVVAQTIDGLGSVVRESTPLTIIVGEFVPAATPLPTGPVGRVDFNPIGGVWQLGGTVSPNATVAVLANGQSLGTATADASGSWALDVPADQVTGDLTVEVTDPSGATTVLPPVAPGPRPPSVSLPDVSGSSPSTGDATASVPAGSYTWTGQAAPGTQVEVVINGAPAGVATADAAGNWVLVTDLAEGEFTLQLNSYDAAGNPVSSTAPIAVVAGTPAGGEGDAGEAAGTGEGTTADESLAGVLAGIPELSSFRATLAAAGLLEPLAGPDTFTVFAPTNDAFAAVPQVILSGLAANRQALTTILEYHVTRGRYSAADLLIVQPSTVNGRLLTITPQGDSLNVNSALVVTADIPAENGLIHAIDRILLPPLAPGVRPPVIDASGAATFVGPRLTVVGTAEPGRTIIVALNGQPFGAPAVVDANGAWQAVGDVAPGEYLLTAFMLNGDVLEAVAPFIRLTAQ